MSSREQAIRLAEAGGKIANLERQNAKLREVVREFSAILASAEVSRTLYCGHYTAKEYNFSTGQIDRLKKMISAST